MELLEIVLEIVLTLIFESVEFVPKNNKKKIANNYLIAKIIKRNIKKRRKVKMALPIMINNLINRQVMLSTLNGSYKGRVAEIENEWVKIVKQTKKGEVSYFIKEDMITSITTL